MTATTTEAPPKVHYRTLAGNLTRDVELRFSAKGTAWATVGLAVNKSKRLDDGTYEDLPPEFFDLVSFGQTAENLAESAAKGDRVLAYGKLEEEQWTGKDGAEHTSHKLVCDEVGLSLRYATVRATKVTRAAAPVAEPPSDYDDEEPF